jgi:hypothetical protein
MTGGANSKRPRLQAAAVAALVAAPSIAEAGRRVNLSERTLRRWLQDATFRAELAKAQRAAFGDGLATLRAGFPQAVATLRALRGKDTPATVRVRAASAIIALALRATELFEFERRLANLEAANPSLRPYHRPGSAA